MESSFCGCDQGPLAGLHLDTQHLKDVGEDFCQALTMMKDGGEQHQQWTLDKYVSWYRRIINSLLYYYCTNREASYALHNET